MRLTILCCVALLSISFGSASCTRRARIMAATEIASTGVEQPSLAFAGASRGATTLAAGSSIRAAYFYDYLPASHLDSLASVGLNRALVKFIADSLGTKGAATLAKLKTRGAQVGVEIVPSFNVQAPSRLASRPASRRYTWGNAHKLESSVGCPLDAAVWQSGLIDRLNEIFAADPTVARVLVDLELYSGSRHHYDAGPCRCTYCQRSYYSARSTKLSGSSEKSLGAAEESRIVSFLTPMLVKFKAAHPSVEVGVFDLDFSSFVHRAVARALVAAKVPTADYTERTYTSGVAVAGAARATLDSLKVKGPLVTGLLLKAIMPANLTPMAKAAVAQTNGYFVFTTYSLWKAPSELSAMYALPAAQADYWRALRAANQ